MELAMDNEIPCVPSQVVIIDAAVDHVRDLKVSLRGEDADEILRFGVTVSRGLWLSYRGAVIRKTAVIDGEPVAMWGVKGGLTGKMGVPFLMTTPGVKKVSPLKFARIYQEEVITMLKLYDKLENWVDPTYTAAIRMLDMIGFTVHEPEPMGYCGAMYRRFEIGG